MSDKIVYDTPRKAEIESFLNFIYEIKKSNPSLKIDKSLVYRELNRYALKKGDMTDKRELYNNRYLFGRWFDTFYPIENINAYCDSNWPDFFQFLNGNIEDDKEFLKLYIPIDAKHLETGVNVLFKYIASLNITHCSKVSEKVRSDNVIIRLKKGDYYNAMRIINYVNSNPYIKKGLNKTNPFVPTISGVGIMEESGISYNKEIANMISGFINKSFKENKRRVTFEEFNFYMNDNMYNDEVDKAYNNSIGSKKSELSSSQKLNLLIDSITATYDKYGLNQACVALKSSIMGNYEFFTNSSKNGVAYRDLLEKNVDGPTIRLFIQSSLEQIYGRDAGFNISEAASKYCNYMFQNDTHIKFEEACTTTLENYDAIQVINAIKRYMIEGKADGFSSYRRSNQDSYVNYRDIVNSIGKENIMEVIKTSLILRGINVNSLSNNFLIQMYVHELEKRKTESVLEESNRVVK